MRPVTPVQRLNRIADAHQPDADGFCSECEGRHPCDTFRWATDKDLTKNDPFHAPTPVVAPSGVELPGYSCCWRCLSARHQECDAGACMCACRLAQSPSEGESGDA